jgi:hypothetical protein
VIIACNAPPARCSVAAMGASRSPVAVSTSMASFSSAGHAGPAHDDEPSSRAPRGSRLAASSASKSILKANS